MLFAHLVLLNKINVPDQENVYQDKNITDLECPEPFVYFHNIQSFTFKYKPLTFWNTGGFGIGGPKDGTSSRAVTDTWLKIILIAIIKQISCLSHLIILMIYLFLQAIKLLVNSSDI